jgi:hypothetical protein
MVEVKLSSDDRPRNFTGPIYGVLVTSYGAGALLATDDGQPRAIERAGMYPCSDPSRPYLAAELTGPVEATLARTAYEARQLAGQMTAVTIKPGDAPVIVAGANGGPVPVMGAAGGAVAVMGENGGPVVVVPSAVLDTRARIERFSLVSPYEALNQGIELYAAPLPHVEAVTIVLRLLDAVGGNRDGFIALSPAPGLDLVEVPCRADGSPNIPTGHEMVVNIGPYLAAGELLVSPIVPGLKPGRIVRNISAPVPYAVGGRVAAKGGFGGAAVHLYGRVIGAGPE